MGLGEKGQGSRVFHPRSPADWFSGARSSVSLVLVFSCLFLSAIFYRKKSGTCSKTCPRNCRHQKVPESPAECRNLRDHVDVSHPRIVLEGRTVSHPVTHSYSSSSFAWEDRKYRT